MEKLFAVVQLVWEVRQGQCEFLRPQMEKNLRQSQQWVKQELGKFQWYHEARPRN